MSKPRQLETRKRIAFSDCDPFRHLNNARYLDYFLDTREEQVEESYGLSLLEWGARGKGWLVRQNQIAYLRPANYREEVLLVSRLIRFSGTTLLVEMLMMDGLCSHLKAFLWTLLTHISIPEGRKQEHPPEFMELLQEIVWEEEGMETEIFEKRLQQMKGVRL
ncbi:MAG: acyl-CoA thioesterase [Williamsia sp.]|nr:acyl-CoA thioesterase [Williamsia sp.]